MTNNDEVIAAPCDLAADAIVEHGHAKHALVDHLGRTPATTVAVFDPRWVIGAPEGAVRTVVEVVS